MEFPPFCQKLVKSFPIIMKQLVFEVRECMVIEDSHWAQQVGPQDEFHYGVFKDKGWGMEI